MYPQFTTVYRADVRVSPDPAITVVLPTFRRPEALGRALEAVRHQDDPGASWEVIVVDNDDPPGAGDAFDAWAATSPIPARLVRELARGASYARNTGIEQAGGDVVAFLDDDVVPERDWLRQLVRPVLAGESDGAAGRVVLDPRVTLPTWLAADWRGYLSEFDPSHEDRELLPDEWLLTANAAFRRDLLRAIGGLDPQLGPRAGVPMVNDDIDLFRRFRGAGGSIRYVRSAVVVHELPASRLRFRYLVRRAYAQGRSDWILERQTLVARKLGGAAGITAHVSHLLADRARQGLWHPEVAASAAFSVSHGAGFLREALGHKLRRIPVEPA